MVEAKRVEESCCDLILSQFSRLVEELHENGDLRSRFQEFDSHKEEDRVDTLFYSCLASNKQYAELWSVIKQLLLLSHGQATVERGFSMNKEVSVENLNQESLVAMRKIVEYVQKCGGVHLVPITKELVLSASSARNRCQLYLEEARRKEAAATKCLKRKAAEEKVSSLNFKKARLEGDIQNLIHQADRLCEQAEEKGSLTLVSQANALRARVKDKQAGLCALQKEIEEGTTSLENIV